MQPADHESSSLYPVLEWQIKSLNSTLSAFYDTVSRLEDPAFFIEQVHWIAKKILIQPVNGAQYAFAEEPPQPRHVAIQLAFAQGSSATAVPETISDAKAVLERYAAQRRLEAAMGGEKADDGGK